ncbi:unnamed protein product [Closterium sp. Naga37s-1]|nr:unnamed protein product [Closterium sp. Naga37s-1]
MSSVGVACVPVAAVSAPLSATVRPATPDARAASVASLCWSSSSHSLVEAGNCRRASATALVRSTSLAAAQSCAASAAGIRCCVSSIGGVIISSAGSSRAQSASSTLSLTTFNILAPIYKRLGGEGERESACEHLWRDRNRRIVDLLLSLQSSVVCLQEFWFDGGDLERMYESHLQASGYTLYKLPRTNARGDGLLTAVRTSAGARGAVAESAAEAAAGSEVVSVVDYEPILFHDCGDRVAQLLRLRITGAGEGGRREGEGQAVENGRGDDGVLADTAAAAADAAAAAEAGQQHEVLVINTHLLFPHNANSSVIRLREVYKILEYVDAYKHAHGLHALPILLAGDLNGPLDGEVCRFLRSQGFVSCYDSVQSGDDTDNNWVSHRNHRGEEVGVDFVWLLNPSQQLHGPLTADWKAAVFRMIKAKLIEAGITEERQAFEFFQSAGTHSAGQQQQKQHGEQNHHDCITPEEFAYAMDESSPPPPLPHSTPSLSSPPPFPHPSRSVSLPQLGLTGEDSVGLTREEIRELVQRADTSGSGAVDYKAFKLLLRTESMEDTFARICKATGIHEQPWIQPRQQQQEQQQQQEEEEEEQQQQQQPWQMWQGQQDLQGSFDEAVEQQQHESRCPLKRGVQALQQCITMDALFHDSAPIAAGSPLSPGNAAAPFGMPEQPVSQVSSSFPMSLGRHGPMVLAAGAVAAASAATVAATAATAASGEKKGQWEECRSCACDRVDCEECGYNPKRRGQQGQQQEEELESGLETRELAVQAAELFPPEMQQGTWPSDYDLSDHAAVTAVLRVL